MSTQTIISCMLSVMNVELRVYGIIVRERKNRASLMDGFIMQDI